MAKTALISGITGKIADHFFNFMVFTEDSHSVPAFLPMPQGIVACIGNSLQRKFFLWRFQFLQANYIRLCLLQPAKPLGGGES